MFFDVIPPTPFIVMRYSVLFARPVAFMAQEPAQNVSQLHGGCESQKGSVAWLHDWLPSLGKAGKAGKEAAAVRPSSNRDVSIFQLQPAARIHDREATIFRKVSEV